jgi:hypothetical protein
VRIVGIASLAVGHRDYERAQKMLERIDPLRPDDLWAFVEPHSRARPRVDRAFLP